MDILRYVLGLIMVVYGLIKILEIQFILPSEVYQLRLIELDGISLTWAFMGYSPWFSILLGFFEFIPATLLLFSKTKYLGAVLLLPTLMAVFFINIAFGFLPHMRIFSGVLLLLDIVILSNTWKLMLKLFNEILQPKTYKFEFILNAILLATVITIVFYYKINI
ncbi:MAG: hypothetical protein KTR26_16745 [Flammeovirgaceae bacterium]|nr:hypothetical protein [Flammeovirgaceae bacterium]